MTTISLKIEFGGGLELLFANQRRHKIELPSRVPVDNPTNEGTFTDSNTKAVDLDYLVRHLRVYLLKERPELFVDDKGTVRPGILVLVNDTDWELEGEEEYELKNEDEIVFISTLHGG